MGRIVRPSPFPSGKCPRPTPIPPRLAPTSLTPSDPRPFVSPRRRPPDFGPVRNGRAALRSWAVYGDLTTSSASFSARATGVEFYYNWFYYTAAYEIFLIYQSCGNIGGSTPQVPWNKVYAHDNWKGPTPPA